MRTLIVYDLELGHLRTFSCPNVSSFLTFLIVCIVYLLRSQQKIIFKVCKRTFTDRRDNFWVFSV